MRNTASHFKPRWIPYIKLLIWSLLVLLVVPTGLFAQEGAERFEYENGVSFLYPKSWEAVPLDDNMTVTLTGAEDSIEIWVIDASSLVTEDLDLENAFDLFESSLPDTIELLNPDAAVIPLEFGNGPALQAEYTLESSDSGQFETTVVAVRYESGEFGIVYGFGNERDILSNYTEQIASTLDTEPTQQETFVFYAVPVLSGRIKANQSVNVRQSPTTNAAIIDVLQPGSEILVTGENEDSSWYQLLLGDDSEGWVAAFLVEIVDTPVVVMPAQEQLPTPTETLEPSPTATAVSTPDIEGCSFEDLKRLPGFSLVNWDRVGGIHLTYEINGRHLVFTRFETDYFFPLSFTEGTLEANGITAQYFYDDEFGDFYFRFQYGGDYYNGDIYEIPRSAGIDVLQSLLMVMNRCG